MTFCRDGVTMTFCRDGVTMTFCRDGVTMTFCRDGVTMTLCLCLHLLAPFLFHDMTSLHLRFHFGARSHRK